MIQEGWEERKEAKGDGIAPTYHLHLPTPRSLSKTSQMPLGSRAVSQGPATSLPLLATPCQPRCQCQGEQQCLPFIWGERSVRFILIRPPPSLTPGSSPQFCPPSPTGVSWEEKASGDPPCAKVPYPANPVEET